MGEFLCLRKQDKKVFGFQEVNGAGRGRVLKYKRPFGLHIRCAVAFMFLESKIKPKMNLTKKNIFIFLDVVGFWPFE